MTPDRKRHLPSLFRKRRSLAMPALDNNVVMTHPAYREIPALRGSLGAICSYLPFFPDNGDPDLINQAAPSACTGSESPPPMPRYVLLKHRRHPRKNQTLELYRLHRERQICVALGRKRSNVHKMCCICIGSAPTCPQEVATDKNRISEHSGPVAGA